AAAGDGKAEATEDFTRTRSPDLETGEATDFGHRELNHRAGRLDVAGDGHLVRAAAAELGDELCRQLDARADALGIDRTLEAVAGVADDAERAGGRGDGGGLAPGALEEDVDRLLGAAGRLAADDAADTEGAFVVGDDAHGLVERVGLAVERGDR